jgi:hypothetical protein
LRAADTAALKEIVFFSAANTSLQIQPEPRGEI